MAENQKSEIEIPIVEEAPKIKVKSNNQNFNLIAYKFFLLFIASLGSFFLFKKVLAKNFSSIETFRNFSYDILDSFIGLTISEHIVLILINIVILLLCFIKFGIKKTAKSLVYFLEIILKGLITGLLLFLVTYIFSWSVNYALIAIFITAIFLSFPKWFYTFLPFVFFFYLFSSLFQKIDFYFANQFNPSFIISDANFLDYDSMNQKEIQKFLKRNNSHLATHVTKDHRGIRRSASQIIYLACQKNKINPKVILVLLQKEQSLITKKKPKTRDYAWATGYARCDKCDPNSPKIKKFKGFGKQVEHAAKRFRHYFDKPHIYQFQVGKRKSVGNLIIRPKNQATASLYNYTPHIHGNKLFWTFWNKWFN